MAPSFATEIRIFYERKGHETLAIALPWRYSGATSGKGALSPPSVICSYKADILLRQSVQNCAVCYMSVQQQTEIILNAAEYGV
jgi:hypothetical protein